MDDHERWTPMGAGELDSQMAGELDTARAGVALALLRREYTRPGRRHRPQLHDVLTRCAAICDRAGIPDLARLPIWTYPVAPALVTRASAGTTRKESRHAYRYPDRSRA